MLVRLCTTGELASGVASPPAHPVPHRVAIEAGLHGDRIALQQWQRDARVASVVAPSWAAIPSQEPAALRLPRPLPLDNAADI